jgi:hypothetical protein
VGAATEDVVMGMVVVGAAGEGVIVGVVEDLTTG